MHWKLSSAVVAVLSLMSVAADPPATSPTTKPDMSPRTAADSIIRKDVPYVPNAAPKQTLDLYAPPSAHDAPVLIFIHGGEWTKGDKSEVSYKPKFLNEHGVMFVAVNYRLAPADKHPAQVQDVASAVRWVYDHATDFGGSAQKIFVMGHSAGCHLATLVALDPRYLAAVDMKPADLAGVISWSGGAFDLPGKVASGGAYADYIRSNFGPETAAWIDASPLHYLDHAGAAPPLLFASAEKGNPASRVLSEQFAADVVAHGGRARTLLLVGKDHTGANHEIGLPPDTTGDALLSFIHDPRNP